MRCGEPSLLATASPLQYIDTGAPAPQGAAPLPLGSTGVWRPIAALNTARIGAAVAIAQDPADATTSLFFVPTDITISYPTTYPNAALAGKTRVFPALTPYVAASSVPADRQKLLIDPKTGGMTAAGVCDKTCDPLATPSIRRGM